MSIILDGTSGITTPTTNGTGEHVTSVTGFKNRIINGGMVIDQRNAGASKTLVAGSSTYVLDRFYVATNGGAGVVQQVAGSGFTKAMRITGAAGITDGYFGQKIESYNISDCASTTVTYTVRASSSVLTSLTWYARFPTAQDNYAGVTAIASGTITINSTPTNYSFQIALPSGVTNGFELYFTFGAFTSGTLDITGVQLEKGSVATSFDYRPYSTELSLCQRYYYNSGSTRASQWQGYGVNSQAIYVSVNYPVKPRTTPTIALTNSATTGGSLSVVVTGTDAFVWGGAGGTTGTNYMFTDYTMSAEL